MNRGPSLGVRMLAYLAALVAVVLLYLPALPGQFAYDDYRAVVNNACVTGGLPVGEALQRDLWCETSGRTTGSYRPLAMMWSRGLYALFGASPLAFRLGSIALYGLVLLLLWRFSAAFKLPVSLRWWMLAWFTLMAVHSEAVLAAAALSDLFLAVTVLLFLLAYARWRMPLPGQEPCRLLGWTLLPLFLLALAAKENGAVLLFVPAILEASRPRPETGRRLLAPVVLSLVMLLITLAYLLMRNRLFGAVAIAVHGSDNPVAGFSFFPAFLEGVAALGKGMLLMLCPAGLSIEHNGCTGGASRLWVGVASGAFMLAGLGWAVVRKRPQWAMAALLLGVTSGVQTLAAGQAPTLLAERHLLLPSAFIAILVAAGMARLWPAISKLRVRRLVLAALWLWVAMQGGFLWLRLPDWRSETDLYRSAVAACPDNYKMRVNLGHDLRTTGRCGEAVEVLNGAFGVMPQKYLPSLHRELGMAYHLCGGFDQAVEQYIKSTQQRRDGDVDKLIPLAKQYNIPRDILLNLPYH